MKFFFTFIFLNASNKMTFFFKGVKALLALTHGQEPKYWRLNLWKTFKFNRKYKKLLFIIILRTPSGHSLYSGGLRNYLPLPTLLPVQLSSLFSLGSIWIRLILHFICVLHWFSIVFFFCANIFLIVFEFKYFFFYLQWTNFEFRSTFDWVFLFLFQMNCKSITHCSRTYSSS